MVTKICSFVGKVHFVTVDPAKKKNFKNINDNITKKHIIHYCRSDYGLETYFFGYLKIKKVLDFS